MPTLFREKGKTSSNSYPDHILRLNSAKYKEITKMTKLSNTQRNKPPVLMTASFLNLKDRLRKTIDI